MPQNATNFELNKNLKGNCFPIGDASYTRTLSCFFRRWARIIEVKESALLPKLHVNTSKLFRKPFKGKLKVNPRNFTTTFGIFSDLVNQLFCCMGNKK